MRKLVTGATLALAIGGTTAATAQAQPLPAPVTVPIIIAHGNGGATLAAAPVLINGRFYPFLIDTGASVSMVDPALVKAAHLATVGKARPMCGIGGCVKSWKVRLGNWSLAGQTLPNMIVRAGPLFNGMTQPFGLLGSDVLSGFGSITLDYDHGQLTLSPTPPPTTTP